MKNVYALLMLALALSAPAFVQANENTEQFDHQSLRQEFFSCYMYCKEEYRDCMARAGSNRTARSTCGVIEELCKQRCRDDRRR